MKSFATSHMKHRRGSLPRDIQEACHRHSLVFGASTQETISALTLGVIGAGGTGSLLIEQLKRLYPKKLVFIDSDRVSVSNLNRLVGATCEDARKRSLKIDIASRGVQELDRRIQCEAINGDFLLELRQRRFLQCDFIFGATDSVAARLAANRLCLAHGIPYLDVGVGAEVKNGTLAASGGQVIKVLPDRGFCLQCAELFDLRIASIEFLDEKERKRQENVGYVKGLNLPSPQIYAINSLVVAWAVWMFQRIVAGEEFGFDAVFVDANNFSTYTKKLGKESYKNCCICGEYGVVLEGDKVDLLTKTNVEDKLGLSQISGCNCIQLPPRGISEPVEPSIEYLVEKCVPGSSATFLGRIGM